MASTDYDLDKALDSLIEEMVTDPNYSEFNNLRDLGVSVVACLKVRMDADGESQPCKGDPVTLKKVGAVERLFMSEKPHYMLIVDFHAWDTSDQRRRMAMIHRGLMRISADRTEQGVKLGTRKPDVVEFTRTVERFGAFSDTLLNCREAFRNSMHRILPKIETDDDPEDQNQGEEGEDNG